MDTLQYEVVSAMQFYEVFPIVQYCKGKAWESSETGTLNIFGKELLKR